MMIDELESEIKVEDTRLTENNMSASDRRKAWWRWLKKVQDWAKMPLEFLFIVILSIGAYLMGLSLYSMTESLIIAIGSPAFSELGLIAWYKAKDRPKNSVKQTETAKRGRNWHVGTSVILLTLNLVVDTATQMLEIEIDGIVYLIFAVIGLTSLLDIIWYFAYKDADDEATIKNEQAKKLEEIKKETMRSRMEAFADAEKIKAEEKLKMWKLLAPEKARHEARIEAAKEVMESYSKTNLTPEQVEALWKNVGYAEGTVKEEDDEIQVPGKRQYLKTGKYKKELQKTNVKELPAKTDSFSQGENQLLEERAKKLDFPITED